MQKEQMPIKQEQVERLISGVVAGYTGLVNLTGAEQQEFAQSDIFTGVSTITLENNAELGKIVNNMFAFGLRDVFQAGNLFHRQVSGAGVPQEEELNAMLNSYKADINVTREQVNNYLNTIEQKAEAKVSDFKEKVTVLNQTLKSKKVQSVADALEAIVSVAGWNTEINTKSVYDAGVAIHQLAGYNNAVGFEQALPLMMNIEQALDQSKVRRIIGYNPFNGKTVGSLFKEVPEQTYKGSLDVELVASEMLRRG